MDDKGYWALMNLNGELVWEHSDSTFRPIRIVEAHGDGYVAISGAGTDLIRLRSDGTVAWRRKLEHVVISGGGDEAILRHGDGYIIVGATTDETYNARV